MAPALIENHVEGFNWYQMAAALGEANAQCSVGAMLEIGEGVRKNPADAVAWFKEAADQGQVDAVMSLSFAYRRGIWGSEKC